jgi:glycosyltransferase involved in cell wall biosynthesis
MIHERLQGQFSRLRADTKLMQQKRRIAQEATRLIAISEHTKADMVELLNLEPAKIDVVPLSTRFGELPPGPSSDKPAFPYLLFVGNRSYYKNFNTLLRAVEPLLPTYGIHLICAGGGSFNTAEHELIGKLGLRPWVRQQPVDDATLAALYREATLFVFPSLYEGFGLPILEAFACRCPCAISNRSSFPEVAGSAAAYFEPADAMSIRSTVEGLLDDAALRNQLINKGTQQLTQYSSQQTLYKTLATYEACLCPR